MASQMKDDYVEYDFSDDELVDSSDEEQNRAQIESLLQNKLSASDNISCRNLIAISSMSSKDVKRMKEEEFEKCMEDALEDLEDLDQPIKQNINTGMSSSRHVTFNESKNSETPLGNAEGTGEESKGNDECEDPLYDPQADDEDEEWVKNERAKHYPAADNASDGNAALRYPPQSDAILSCPACMTIVCIDCQRHDFYTNQYRAMFVMNCQIVCDEVLNVAEKSKRSRGGKKGKRKSAEMKEDEERSSSILAEGMNCTKAFTGVKNFQLQADQFHPVKCTVCTTEIAVYDRDEVYHFFNTMASLP